MENVLNLRLLFWPNILGIGAILLFVAALLYAAGELTSPSNP